jgi:hypothetical protein
MMVSLHGASGTGFGGRLESAYSLQRTLPAMPVSASRRWIESHREL